MNQPGKVANPARGQLNRENSGGKRRGTRSGAPNMEKQKAMWSYPLLLQIDLQVALVSDDELVHAPFAPPTLVRQSNRQVLLQKTHDGDGDGDSDEKEGGGDGGVRSAATSPIKASHALSRECIAVVVLVPCPKCFTGTSSYREVFLGVLLFSINSMICLLSVEIYAVRHAKLSRHDLCTVTV